MTTNEDWDVLSKAMWNHESGMVSLDGQVLRRLMNESTELRRTVKELEIKIDAAVDANPFAKVKPSEHSPVADDMVNKLRGIYRTVLPDKDADLFNGTGICESRYADGALSHQAADRMEALLAEVELLRADAARFRWLADQNHWALFEANRPMPGVAAVTPESIDELAGEEATWLPK